MSFHRWLQPLRGYLKSGPAQSRVGRRHRARPRLEPLEDRTVPSTFIVTNLLDDGSAGSLRAAINQANAAPDPDTISFAPGLAGTVALAPTRGELDITASLTIDGPGADRLTVSGNLASRIFNVSGSTTNVVIRDLTIAHGLASGTTELGPSGPVTLGGGLLNSGGHVTLSGVILADNRAVASQPGYVQTNLVSDIPGLAQLTDPNLRNPWGMSFSDTGLFSVSDTKANVSTLYSVTATGVSAVPPTIAIQTTATGNQGPTGQVHNDTSSFLVNGTPATFIYANLNGTISAWNSSAGTTAVVTSINPAAAYQGLDMASTASGDYLYAANARQGRIDVFDHSFNHTSLEGDFQDPVLPAGLVPFNVEEINGHLYVAYAPAGPPAARQMAPRGAGVVAEFNTNGTFITQLISGGPLASPWGITLAPSSFGPFGGALLVGNFSYLFTEINAFDPVSGAYLGTLTDASGNTLLAGDNGLWDLTFGIGGNGGLPGTLYFTTGLNDEINGLFGAIAPTPSIAAGGAAGGAVANVSGGTLDIAYSTFTGNVSAGTREAAGGGIANDAGSSLTVAHSTFTSNRAIGADSSTGDGGGAFGGAISNRGGSQATLLQSTFANNLAHGGNGANGGAAQNGGNGGLGVGGAIANLNDSSLVAGAGSTLIIDHTTFTGNQCIGGAGGNGGAGGTGGNGVGGNGGAITNVGEGSTALVTYSGFTSNQALGGAGGNGGAGKKGGTGGNGQGGAIVQFSATLTVEYSKFIGNQATGGAGGNGGSSGNGGAGGPGAGGAINSGVASPTPTLLPTLMVDHLMIQGNRATGGRGGNGGSSGNGGNGGLGTGGGIRARGTLDVAYTQLLLNLATGGAGGDRGAGGLLGGNGGLGTGGGLVLDLGATGTVSHTSLVGNQATGGAGGVGGNGGNGQGGGIWIGGTNPVGGTPSTLTIVDSTIVNNRADGGAAGSEGSPGLGQGGGLYIVAGASVYVDQVTHITGNHASTSDDEVFGILLFI
jgi:uncharacterized protein (TIGR03118 family)